VEAYLYLSGFWMLRWPGGTEITGPGGRPPGPFLGGPVLAGLEPQCWERRLAGMRTISAAECQERALECMKLAQSAKTTKKRDILYAMSKHWQALAAQAIRYEQADDDE
jgi:hypothetical protein